MELMDVGQAAEYLKLSPQRIRQFCGQGRLGTKLGSRWIFSKDELDEFQAIPRPPGRAAVGEEGGDV